MIDVTELISYVQMLDSNDFQVKGDDDGLLIRPTKGIGFTLNGIRFEDTKAIIIRQQGATIYYGTDMIEKNVSEIREFYIDGYSWEMIDYDARE